MGGALVAAFDGGMREFGSAVGVLDIDTRFLPYPKQLVPLAAIRVMGSDADLVGPRAKLVRWLWRGILGELYGGAIETRFVRDLKPVPAWARGGDGAATPNTVNGATFVESRLHSLRTRNAAAYEELPDEAD